MIDTEVDRVDPLRRSGEPQRKFAKRLCVCLVSHEMMGSTEHPTGHRHTGRIAHCLRDGFDALGKLQRAEVTAIGTTGSTSTGVRVDDPVCQDGG